MSGYHVQVDPVEAHEVRTGDIIIANRGGNSIMLQVLDRRETDSLVFLYGAGWKRRMYPTTIVQLVSLAIVPS